EGRVDEVAAVAEREVDVLRVARGRAAVGAGLVEDRPRVGVAPAGGRGVGVDLYVDGDGEVARAVGDDDFLRGLRSDGGHGRQVVEVDLHRSGELLARRDAPAPVAVGDLDR